MSQRISLMVKSVLQEFPITRMSHHNSIMCQQGMAKEYCENTKIHKIKNELLKILQRSSIETPRIIGSTQDLNRSNQRTQCFERIKPRVESKVDQEKFPDYKIIFSHKIPSQIISEKILLQKN